MRLYYSFLCMSNGGGQKMTLQSSGSRPILSITRIEGTWTEDFMQAIKTVAFRKAESTSRRIREQTAWFFLRHMHNVNLCPHRKAKRKNGTAEALYSFSLVRSTALWYDKCIHKAVHHGHRRYSHRSAVQAKFWSDFIQWADHAGADESIHNLHTSEQHCRPNGKRTDSCMG